MKLYDDNGQEVTNPKVLSILTAIEEFIADASCEKEEDDYSDLEIYDDDGTKITNRDTLRAIREAIIISGRSRMILRNGRAVTNPKVLDILEAVIEFVADYVDNDEEPDYSDIELYDDDGTRVTNRDTLAAIRESDHIITEWEMRHMK